MRTFVIDHVVALAALVGIATGLIGGGSGLYQIVQLEHQQQQHHTR